MDNLDDSENNAKISDSAYSNSCSNSQSRRSRSSKSTHSGSNSSGSSGYGGKQSTSGSSNNLRPPPAKRSKDNGEKMKQVEAALAEIQKDAEFRLPQPALPSGPKKQKHDAAPSTSFDSQDEKGVQDVMASPEAMPCDDTVIRHTSQCPMQVVASRNTPTGGFSCVISMHDGVVMHTTSSLTNTIGFPKEMWIGRSFIDFVHPLDHSTFASQVTNGLTFPKKDNGPTDPAHSEEGVSTMFCRIRKYRGLKAKFGIKERSVSFMPFTLKLSFKAGNEDKGVLIYLVIQATPLCSAFKSAHEILANAVSFVIRHVSNGNLEHMDPESVPFLGYFPQDIAGKDVLRFYHPEDLLYLRQIYETIVKEGSAPRSKPYRLMAQNGDYLKLETEWKSFVNPWSRKLEFVVAKHHVLEGPANPDVFQPPIVLSTRDRRATADKRKEAICLRENIVRIMNKALTKPAEIAKQQMSKRCQDLASFMETLIQEPPMLEEELRVVEIQEPSSSYEPDSEILGGISPHRDYCSDSKSSSGIPLNYNQLNFNDNLQRFFDNHQELTHQEYQHAIAGHIDEMKDYIHPFLGGRLSPMALHSMDSADVTSSGESSSGPYVFKKHMRDASSIRLTESLLSRHNTDMERTLVRKHRDCRSATKEEREKANYATKQKKKEHLARCNASFVPTCMNSSSSETQVQPRCLKRPSRRTEEEGTSRKHACPERQSRRRHAGSPEPYQSGPSASAFASRRPSEHMHPPAPHMPNFGSQPHTSRASRSPAVPTTSYRPSNNVSDMRPYVSNFGMHPGPVMSPLPNGPGMIPFLYVPTTGHAMPSTSGATAAHQYPGQPMQYVMYGPAVVGSPIMVSPISAQPFAMQDNMGPYRDQRNATSSSSNFEESSEPVVQPRPISLEPKPKRNETGTETGNSSEAVDRTDVESSSSSFYSSFFKTESGSADDSGDARNVKKKPFQNHPVAHNSKDNVHSKVVRRKMEPPWMEQVFNTPELIYKYQIRNQEEEEVLAADRRKMATMEQPTLVNEQLGQLYTDLQIEGVAARLTLDEGLTSSSSSDEGSKYSMDCSPKRTKKKREYTKLVMIYEEDAPMPPPSQYDEPTPSTSLS